MPNQSERDKAIAELEAAEAELAEGLRGEGDIFVRAFARRVYASPVPVRAKRDRLAARVGYLRELVHRNERRSDNA